MPTEVNGPDAKASTDEAGPGRERYIVHSLARGLTVLESFLDSPGPVRLTELSERLQVEKATLFRYCVTLQVLGYLDLDPLTKEYTLGTRARDLGLAARHQNDVLGLVRVWLPVVADRYGGTASFAVLAGDEVVYIDRKTTEGSLSYSLSIGARLPVARSSIGKTLIADGPEERAEAFAAGIREAEERERFVDAVTFARTHGFALNLGGSHPGVNSVAVPIRDGTSRKAVGGLNVAAMASEFPKRHLVAGVGPYLLSVAEHIMNGQPPDD